MGSEQWSGSVANVPRASNSNGVAFRTSDPLSNCFVSQKCIGGCLF